MPKMNLIWLVKGRKYTYLYTYDWPDFTPCPLSTWFGTMEIHFAGMNRILQHRKGVGHA